MSILPSNASLVEIIYYLCAPLTFFLAWRALAQVVEMRKQNQLTIDQMKDKEEKESFQRAIDLCEKFRIEYISNYGDFSSLRELGIAKEIEKIRPFNFTIAELLKYKSGEEAYAFIMSSDNAKVKEDAMCALNFLEFFAMNFTSEIASKKIAFAPLHRVFIDDVELFYPFICVTNRYADSRLYNNVICLYKEWVAQVLDIAKTQDLILKEKSQIAENYVQEIFAPTTRKHKNTPTDVEV